jgi:methyl-accepting chemotaxis protein
MRALRLFTQLKIGARLYAGFAAVCLILALAVGYTISVVGSTAQMVDRMVGLRTPVALTSTELVSNLYSTLATLRGYLLAGNPQGKADRAAMWKELDANEAAFDKMAERFTNPENKRMWADAKALIREFRADRTKRKRSPSRLTLSRRPSCCAPRACNNST